MSRMASVGRAVRTTVTKLSFAVAVSILIGLLAAEAQQAAKAPRIGYLGSKVASAENHAALSPGTA